MSDRPYIDRNGRRHTAAVFEAWSPRMIEIMGVRECTPAELEAPKQRAIGGQNGQA